jgi:hypothetical protein
MSCDARTIPTTTGLTNSRWLGFGASTRGTSTVAPSAFFARRAPRWYFTSPVTPLSMAESEGDEERATLPSKAAMMAAYGLPSTWVSTLRRPRWAMPSTTSRTPPAAASLMIVSSIGTSASDPSTEKRFCPR